MPQDQPIRAIPPGIQNNFRQLKESESFRDAMSWLLAEYNDSLEIGERDESSDYQKGLNDGLLFFAKLVGWQPKLSLEPLPKHDESSNETTDQDTQ
jgi:hypothetical protein